MATESLPMVMNFTLEGTVFAEDEAEVPRVVVLLVNVAGSFPLALSAAN